MSYGQNDILYNIENDMDKTERVSISLTKGEKDALRRYREDADQTWSDAGGDLIVWLLRARGYLPYEYTRGDKIKSAAARSASSVIV